MLPGSIYWNKFEKDNLKLEEIHNNTNTQNDSRASRQSSIVENQLMLGFYHPALSLVEENHLCNLMF